LVLTIRFHKPTVKAGLAAIRLDWLVTGQVVSVNPAASVSDPTQW
jgi:hypothetical protein